MMMVDSETMDIKGQGSLQITHDIAIIELFLEQASSGCKLQRPAHVVLVLIQVMIKKRSLKLELEVENPPARFLVDIRGQDDDSFLPPLKIT